MQKNKAEKNIPKHIGLIASGQKQWAEERNLVTKEGHRKGFSVMNECPKWFFDQGVSCLSVFAFLSDSWQKNQEEVAVTMKLLKQFLQKEIEKTEKGDYRVLVSGRVEELPGDLPSLISELESETKLEKRGTLHLCINYNGRNEIIDMIKKIVEKDFSAEQIHEGILRKYLYHGELDDPDLIFCTSGNRNLSSFLTWQSINSELMFSEKLWPDFEKSDVEKIIQEWNNRFPVTESR